MTAEKWFSKIGSFVAQVFAPRVNGEMESLRQEINRLKADLHTLKVGGVSSTKQEIEILRSDLQGSSEREILLLKQEIDILRNEVLDNIAAIHRLEILTLSQRIELLNQFGKALPPTIASRTKESFKPQGFSFGIITNGKRDDKIVRLMESIRMQNLAVDQYEILVAGCVDGILARSDTRTFSMDQAAAEGRLGAMRNVLARNASFNKFVCLDDDFLLHPGWAQAVLEVDGDFDLATGIILNPDLSRYCDWVSLIENYTFLKTYHEVFDKCRQYMTGGYGIYKDYVFVDQCWDDHLGFYQGEDVSFSKRLFDAGYQLKFIPQAIVMHDDERYRQKGYGVIRMKAKEEVTDMNPVIMRMEKLCPRSLS
jgi:hypothetical protein